MSTSKGQLVNRHIKVYYGMVKEYIGQLLYYQLIMFQLVKYQLVNS